MFLKLVSLQRGVSRLNQMNDYAAFFKAKPRKNVGGKIALHYKNFVTGSPGKAVSQEVKAVRCAVAQNDIFGRRVYESSQRLLQALRHRVERVVGNAMWGNFPEERFLRSFDGNPRQRPLVSTVEPDPAIEGSEIFTSVLHDLAMFPTRSVPILMSFHSRYQANQFFPD